MTQSWTRIKSGLQGKDIQHKKLQNEIVLVREVSVFYLFRHLTSKRADLARLGGELGGKLQGQVHLRILAIH